MTAAYVYNRVPTRVHGNSPILLWGGFIPAIQHIRVFGCAAYVNIPEELRDSEFSSNVSHGIMVGYSQTRKAYRIFLGGKIIETRNGYFNENIFPKIESENMPDTSSSIYFDTFGN